MKHRLALILPAYFASFCAAYYAAYQLRFEFDIPWNFEHVFWATLPFVLVMKLLICHLTGEWNRSFRHASMSDIVSLGIATIWITLSVMAVNIFGASRIVPRSVVLIDAVMTMLILGSMRMAIRTYVEVIRPKLRGGEHVPTLIFGARQESIGLVKTLQAGQTYRRHDYQAVGFVDETDQQRSKMCGLPVYSLGQGWPAIIEQTGARQVLIPAEMSGKRVRALLHECLKLGVKVSVIPSVDEIVDGRVKLAVRDVTVSDLLRREPNVLDMDGIRDIIAGRVVLVTGAAGSIGSELCRQIRSFHPCRMILVDQSESGMFYIERELQAKRNANVDLKYIVADIVDEPAMSRIMEEHRPHIIFHAAAYKHVPLMEDNPRAAIINNVVGTRTVIDVAARHGVERFVMISTDKAVRPTSVMGASKLIAEKYLQAKAATCPMRMVAVRFGNVLNSVGSVVPIFKQQIQAGGPITVTHPDMERFFMTIPEAVQLVLQAGTIGETGDVLILDMGEPVKIVDLAKDMIALSGLRYPDDIDIAFTGTRPGEKLTEELFYASECGAKKVHDRIYTGSAEDRPHIVSMIHEIDRLEESAQGRNVEMLEALRDVVAGLSDAAWVPSRLQSAA
jgi:FlaA1/EpsC-like NDP-sugar epimerase